MNIKDKRVGYIIAGVVLILFLCFLLGCFDAEVQETVSIPDDDDNIIISSSASGSKGALPEGFMESQHINWDECCPGFVTVTLTYSWDFFIGEEFPDDYECDNPVIWQVADSTHIIKWDSEEDTPNSDTVTIRGYWNCMDPWEINIINQCIPTITLSWNMVMVCD